MLQSSGFVGNGPLPAEYTCDGADTSPPLAWSGAPVGSGAFSLVEQDVDVAQSSAEPFTQWLVYNIPRTIAQLGPSVPPSPLLSNGSQQGLNSSSAIGYLGPCPTRGDPPHHLSFQLFAQDRYVTLETGAPIADVRSALQGHILGQAQLVATVQR